MNNPVEKAINLICYMPVKYNKYCSNKNNKCSVKNIYTEK